VKGVIWAQAANGVIGRDGALPWRLPEDLANFRTVTGGSTVLMGRRTWESLPDRFRPLPGRVNIVLTRDPHFAAAGALRASSLPDALGEVGDVWVIGGAAVYAEALPHLDVAVITEIDETFEGDVFAPTLGEEWAETGPTPDWSTADNGLRYRFRNYRRRVL